MDFRTDMAIERINIYKEENHKEEIDGVISKTTDLSENIKLTIVDITNLNGETALGKQIGRYITIDTKKIRFMREEDLDILKKCIIDNLKEIVDRNIDKNDEVLVVGLGNLYSTPDALGTKVVHNLEITRHIKKYMPDAIDNDVRSVSAIVPGVLGTTGIDSIEIIQGVKDKINPKAVIVIDSLASNSLERIGNSIQISDTGISPGGGVGNKRPEINKETLKIPVIAIGVPTVVDLKNILDVESSNDMIVTPKEIDDLIDIMKDIISEGINKAI